MSKSRSRLVGTVFGHQVTYNGSAITAESNNRYSCLKYEFVDSGGHPWPPKKGNKLNLGGGFVHYSVEDSFDAVNVSVSTPRKPYPGASWSFDGLVRANSPLTFGSIKLGTIQPSPAAELDAIGASCIARCIPTNPLAGMGQFVGELRDLPKIPAIHSWKDKAAGFRNLAKNGSSEYLNIQFGWIPFISDLQKFGKTVAHQSKRIQEFDNGVGKPVHRRQSGPTTSSTVITPGTTNSFGWPAPIGNLVGSAGKSTLTVTTTRNRWFSGAFTYYLPPPGSLGVDKLRRFEQLGNRLYGARLTPDLLWKLAPWSWAVDWVTNIGDVIHNYSAFQNDGLVMKYGYVMETTTRKTITSVQNITYIDGSTASPRDTLIAETKVRRGATPYGFGLSPIGFSAKQWTIIAALGISRAPRSLNF